MKDAERRLTERLLTSGTVRPEALEQGLSRQQAGEGVIDALVRQGTVSTAELEAALAELHPNRQESFEPDAGIDAIRKLDRYVLMNELGRGGMGRVYLAYDAKLKRSVALKAIPVRDPEHAARSKRELEIAAALQHPNIAAIYDGHLVDTTFIISMQYIDGRPLDAVKLGAREALAAAAQAARAIEHAHARGIVHRDLKPENLMMTGSGHVYVLDFGIARPMAKATALTDSGSVIGTPHYMSPEQASGRELDGRSDVYSLGATLYALVTQRPPFEGTAMIEIIQRVVGADPVPPRKHNPRLHRDIETLILKAMRKAPAERYGSMKEFAEDLERFQAGEPIQARPLSITAKAAHYLRRRPWAIATIVAVVLGLGASATTAWMQYAKSARIAEATARVDQAERSIAEWDRYLDYMPRDLTPYRKLLEEAVALCVEAQKVHPQPFARAHHQQARAMLRLGDVEKAKRALGDAILIRRDGAYYVERARLRMHELTRRMMNTSTLSFRDLGDMMSERPKRPESRGDAELAMRILDDLRTARELGAEAPFEMIYAGVVEQGLKGHFEEAVRMGGEAIDRVDPLEGRELHRILAWCYERWAGSRAKSEIPSRELGRAHHHISRALEHGRSNADLYLFRAYLCLLQAEELDLLEGEAGAGVKVAGDLREARLRELRRAELAASARRDVETALVIRPRDVDALILLGNIIFVENERSIISINWMERRAVFPASGVTLVAGLGAMRQMEKICLRGLEIEPAHPAMWAQLAATQFVILMFSLHSREHVALGRTAEASIKRAVELGGDLESEWVLRFFRLLIHAVAWGRGEAPSEEEGAVLREDCARVRRNNPGFIDLVHGNPALEQMLEAIKADLR